MTRSSATPAIDAAATKTDGLGCHAGAAELKAAAGAAGKSDILDRYAADYPEGPHDQPQSMCPAFGSLRVGLRMRRTATVLSGSACCVYGLTFTSHFYGASRTVGYVPFNSETLVTGKLFEDIREAVFKLADPANLRRVVIINLCVPTASGVPLHLLPKEINGVRIIGIDVPGFGVPTHAEAKDVLAGAMLRYARERGEARPGAGAARAAHREADRHADRRDVSGRSRASARCWICSASPPDRSRRRGNGANSMARSIARLSRRSIRSTPPAFREFEAAGRTVIGSAPVGREGTAAGSRPSARPATSARHIDAAKDRLLPAIAAALAAKPIKGRITLSGYEGSELLVARLLVESGADVRYVGTACPRTPWSEADREWLAAKGVQVHYRASLEQDLAAMQEFRPTSPSARHRSSRKPRQRADSGAVLHQPHLCAALLGVGRRRLAGAGRQRGDRPIKRASTR